MVCVCAGVQNRWNPARLYSTLALEPRRRRTWLTKSSGNRAGDNLRICQALSEGREAMVPSTDPSPDLPSSESDISALLSSKGPPGGLLLLQF